MLSIMAVAIMRSYLISFPHPAPAQVGAVDDFTNDMQLHTLSYSNTISCSDKGATGDNTRCGKIIYGQNVDAF